MSNLFSPSVVRDLYGSGYAFKNLTRDQLTGSAPESDLVWRDDPYGTGLKSSQQISLDWSKFEHHTFFNNAESKVNVAFERIINGFPFDGSKKEVSEFEDSLGGFEKYIFDAFPKYKGDLKFTKSSSQSLAFQDKSGYLFPDISRNVLGERVIAGASDSGDFTCEFWLYPSSSTAYDNQTIFQKLNTSNNHGISLFISQSSVSGTTLPILMGVSSGSVFVSASVDIPKGEYSHLAFSYDSSSDSAISVYVNSLLQSTSSVSEISKLDFAATVCTIASGSQQKFRNISFAPQETLDANLDEFRFWKNVRSQQQIKEFYRNNVFQQEDLALYYRFNEPTGSFANKSLALDHSGNGLHGSITNFSETMRGTKEQFQLPMHMERSYNSPVLFPDYPSLLTLNADLLTSASLYDNNNPNAITKLIPPHYFLEGQAEEGLENEFGAQGEAYGYNESSFPGNGKLPSSQVLSSFLFVWASFFDEIKIYLDSFAKLHDISHSAINSVPSQFLITLGRRYGLDLPNSFSSAKLGSYSSGENLTTTEGYGTLSLREVQELLWRRLLAEMPNIQRSKGTIHSVKSLMLSLGINPDTNFRIREFGGPKTKKLQNNRSVVNSYYNSIDFSKGTPFMSSSYLSAYRHASGVPFGGPTPERIIIDHMGAESSTMKVSVPGTPPALTMLTSASWSWEGHYILNPSLPNQSLFRIESSGSSTPGTKPGIVVNLTAVSGSKTSSGQPGTKLILAFSGSEASKLSITGSNIDIYDGNPWYVNINHTAGNKRSEFAVRTYRTNGTDILESHYFSGSYSNSGDTVNRLCDVTSGKRNFVAIGSSSNYTNELLNQSGDNTVDFNGKLGSMRFWTKALELNESKEHALNPYSVGVNKPLANYNFITPENIDISKSSAAITSGSLPLGSWERLRLSTDLYQEISSSNGYGRLDVIDTSKNGHFGFSGFTAATQVFEPTIKLYSRLDPNYDITTNVNKVRIRSVQNIELASEINADANFVYDLDPREPITDDRRFSVEASIVQALNEDMVNILADNQYINDAMGTPEQMFAVNYPALERLSDKYFNRLTDKINTNEYYKFFKWFDNNYGNLIEKIIPRTTEFLGINFVIESHMFERHKLEYKQGDVHIDLNSRLAARIEPFYEGKIQMGST
jgi:hypothetical protein